MLLFIEELILQLFKLIINSDIVSDMIFEKIINFVNSRALFQSIKKM